MSTKTKAPSAAQILAQIKNKKTYGPPVPLRQSDSESGTIERVNIPGVNRPKNWAGSEVDYYYISPWRRNTNIISDLFEDFPAPERNLFREKLRAVLKIQPSLFGNQHCYRLLDGHMWAPAPENDNTLYVTDYERIWEERVMGKTRYQHYLEQVVMGWPNLVVEEHIVKGYRAGNKALIDQRDFEVVLRLSDTSSFTFYYEWDDQAEDFINFIRTETGLPEDHWCFYGEAIFIRYKIDAIPLLFSNKVTGVEIHDPDNVDPEWFIRGVDKSNLHPEAQKLFNIW